MDLGFEGTKTPSCSAARAASDTRSRTHWQTEDANVTVPARNADLVGNKAFQRSKLKSS